MPKSTFFNLPEEKRERITDVAIDEFAAHSFHKASINRIVEKGGIAKGSFYQYFKDKKDIFKYVLDMGSQKKVEYLNRVMNNLGNLDFFQTLRELYIGGIKFAKEHPKLAAIVDRFIKEPDNKLKEEIYGEAIP